MNHCLDNNNNREGNSSNDNDNDNDTGNRSEGPPRKKPKTMIIVNDLPEPGTHADNEGQLSQPPLTLITHHPNSDIQHAGDKGLSSCHRTRLEDPLYVILLMLPHC